MGWEDGLLFSFKYDHYFFSISYSLAFLSAFLVCFVVVAAVVSLSFVCLFKEKLCFSMSCSFIFLKMPCYNNSESLFYVILCEYRISI